MHAYAWRKPACDLKRRAGCLVSVDLDSFASKGKQCGHCPIFHMEGFAIRDFLFGNGPSALLVDSYISWWPVSLRGGQRKAFGFYSSRVDWWTCCCNLLRIRSLPNPL
jgi:hypothetical protein